ncbi:MAG: YidC/Oxa1 family membrane protein insertase [Candidatus Borkfalkiaceae bacterium]|nr:YidC/Oxa1 family membrane protein insertase [Christensenellaceae bacterium]
MNISDLLSVIVPFMGDLGSISAKYQWILNVITWFINLVADVGVGIMLFTLALKLITLPLDIFSRASMKKNALKMEMMRGDLEKLQKQYANNKQLYQQKMMALYKKNGYSAFSACLPTIVTLVFFFIVIGAFNSYSKQTDFQVFKDMGKAYDTKLEETIAANGDSIVYSEKDECYHINLDFVLNEKGYRNYFDVIENMSATDENRYILKSNLTPEEVEFVKTYLDIKDENFTLNDDNRKANSVNFVKKVAEKYEEEYILKDARKAAAETYEKNRSKSVVFPWVKNLWVVDSPFKPAIPTYTDLSTTLYGKSGNPAFTEEKYNELTADLGKYKQTGFGKGNGLYILVALSILTMLASTLIMNKTQKTQMELSTVDGANGQAAMQQKMMTWMMPVMFGIFAFIYSSGFSIYMVTSSVLSTAFTLLINFCVEKSFKNKLAKEDAVKNEKPRYGKRR